jgi:drug/metabolite transporter (DMT)-like permease
MPLTPKLTPNALSKGQGLLAVHAAVVLFGLAGLFGRLLSMPPLVIVEGRTIVAAISLWIIVAVGKRRFRLDSLRQALMLLLSGGILTLHWGSFFYAIQISSVAVGLLTFSTFPLFVTFLEPLISREPIRGFDILTAGAVLAGLVLVVPAFDFSNRIFQGALWGVASGLTFAILSLMNRQLVKNLPALSIAACQNSVAAALLAPVSLARLGHVTIGEMGLLLFLGFFCTALAHALFIHGLSDVKAQLSAIIAALEPVYGIFFAFVLLGEIPALRTLIGGAIICGTVLLANLNRGKGTERNRDQRSSPMRAKES